MHLIFAAREGGGTITVFLTLVADKLMCLLLYLCSLLLAFQFPFFLFVLSHSVCDQSALFTFALLQRGCFTV